jgi:hypothetical protein
MFAVSRRPLKVLLGACWISNRELGGEVFDDYGGNVRWIIEEDWLRGRFFCLALLS